MFNKKVHQILNSTFQNLQKPPQHNPTTAHKVKNRMNINQLQTSTRSIQQAKYPNDRKNINQLEIKNLTEFKDYQQQKQKNDQLSSSINHLSSSSSRILSKFDSIQFNYVQKIKNLTFKVSFLQQKVEQIQSQNKSLLESLETYKFLCSKKQQDINKQVQQKLQIMKQKLIQKFSQECRIKYQQFINQMKEMTSLFNQQKKKRLYFQDQCTILKMEKDNLDQLYKNILAKQKHMLRIDIERIKNQMEYGGKNESDMNNDKNVVISNAERNKIMIQDSERQIIQLQTYKEQFYNKENKKNNINDRTQLMQKSKQKSFKGSKQKSKNKSISLSKKSQHSYLSKDKSNSKHSQRFLVNSPKIKKKSKNNNNKLDNNQPQQMSKQQLIPFLAKGIQQLKQKLKMK